MKKLKVIMIDALKPQYLEHAPYLSSLTKRFQWGELKMPAGHEGGVEIVFKGSSDKLALFLKKEKSSLRFTRYFSFLEKFGKSGRFILDCMINFPRFLARKELFRTGQIPMKELWKFDFSIQKPFYEKSEIDFKYIGDLDKIGHEFGTDSNKIISAIKKVDKKVSEEKFDLVFSDHGMINITKTISVPKTNNCFIDSDLARYWGNKEELQKIKKELPLKEGKIINWQNKKYGDLIFIAKPGRLILPNFWQGDKKIKAMHGYFGEHPEMKGIYIVKRIGKRKDVDAKGLHEILKEIKGGRE